MAKNGKRASAGKLPPMSKHGQNGGNGAYANRKRLADSPNPKKAPVSPKGAYDYAGRDIFSGKNL